MKQKLTQKQEALLKCIETYIHRYGYSPSIRELMKELGYKSNSTVHVLLDKLVEKGYISKESGGPRTIRILKNANSINSFSISMHPGGFTEVLIYEGKEIRKEYVVDEHGYKGLSKDWEYEEDLPDDLIEALADRDELAIIDALN